MEVLLVGPGRAGLALSLRMVAAGHRIVAVLARDAAAASAAADRLDSVTASWEEPLPPADLLLVSVRDDAITEVGGRLAPIAGGVEGAVHLSGLAPASALSALTPAGLAIGSFHPLQTLPTPEAGAERLEGAWVGVTTNDDLLADRLFSLASSLGMRPFHLDGDAKALYHAAAAAAANYPLAALSMAERLFEESGVPFAAAGPLIEAVVGNALAMGPQNALTGPIARGDVGTVRSQVAAVRLATPDIAADFEAMVRVTARVAGTAEVMESALQ